MPNSIDNESKLLIFIVALAIIVSIWMTYKHFIVFRDFNIEQSESEEEVIY